MKPIEETHPSLIPHLGATISFQNIPLDESSLNIVANIEIDPKYYHGECPAGSTYDVQKHTVDRKIVQRDYVSKQVLREKIDELYCCEQEDLQFALDELKKELGLEGDE